MGIPYCKKITIKRTLFYLVYGMDSIMHVEFEMPTYQISITDRLPLKKSLVPRLEDLEKLEKKRLFAVDETYKQQLFKKNKYNHKMKLVNVKEGDWVLMYDSWHKTFKEKLDTRWLGPFKVKIIYKN
jgi:hypothetical protein